MSYDLLNIVRGEDNSYLTIIHKAVANSDICIQLSIARDSHTGLVNDRAFNIYGILLEYPYIKNTAWNIFKLIKDTSVKRIFFTGNTVDTIIKNSRTQESINRDVFEIIEELNNLTNGDFEIVTCGQSGVETAAVVAGIRLGLKTTCYMTKWHKQRAESGKDVPYYKDGRELVKQGFHRYAKNPDEINRY